MFLTLAVLISVLILLIIMSVTLVPSSLPPTPISQLTYSPTNSISIIFPSLQSKGLLISDSIITVSESWKSSWDFREGQLKLLSHWKYDILKYAKTWGYSIDYSIPTDYTFYINDDIESINLAKDLGHIINMMGNSTYVSFLNSNSFIIKNNTILNAESTQYENLLKVIHDDITLSEDILLQVVETGFPYRTTNGIILSRQYLDEIIKNKSHTFKDIVIIPSVIKPRLKTSYTTNRSNNIVNETNSLPTEVKFKADEITTLKSQPTQYSGATRTVEWKIPKVIYQTFETMVLPSRFVDAINTWLIRNPEYKYKYYDAGDRIRFIQKYFEDRVSKAYDKLIPGAYKADFWRYCVIYIKGGVYVDIKMGAKMPLKEIIDADTEMLFVNDEPEGMLYNAFFASTARNSLLYDVIMKIVHNIETDYYGTSPLFPTGPVPMGSIIIPALGYNDHIPIGKFVTSYGIVQIYSFHHIHGDARLLHYIGSDPDNAIIRVRNTPNTHDQDFLLKITGVPNYGVLWNEKKIYNT